MRGEERGEDGQWVRLHRTPRASLFTPFRVPRGPGRKSRRALIRHTVRVDETGMKFDITDDWTHPGVAHCVLPQRWTGITIFRTSAFDDQGFGGDQRRQRPSTVPNISRPYLNFEPVRNVILLLYWYKIIFLWRHEVNFGRCQG